MPPTPPAVLPSEEALKEAEEKLKQLIDRIKLLNQYIGVFHDVSKGNVGVAADRAIEELFKIAGVDIADHGFLKISELVPDRPIRLRMVELLEHAKEHTGKITTLLDEMVEHPDRITNTSFEKVWVEVDRAISDVIDDSKKLEHSEPEPATSFILINLFRGLEDIALKVCELSNKIPWCINKEMNKAYEKKMGANKRAIGQAVYEQNPKDSQNTGFIKNLLNKAKDKVVREFDVGTPHDKLKAEAATMKKRS